MSNYLPAISFDIDQSGDVRKAEEACALYTTMIVAHVLEEDIYRDEVNVIAKTYDFKEMKSKSSVASFSNLLDSWKNENSVIINIIVSACNYKLSASKKSIDNFLKDGLSDSEVAGLRDLDLTIRAVNQEYNDGKLSQKEIVKLTKIERLKLIDEKDTIIASKIAQSKFGTLYRIFHLTTEYITPVKKKKLYKFIVEEVDKYINKVKNYKSPEFILDRSTLISWCYKKAIKAEKYSIRRLEVELYKEGEERYKLPSK